MNNLNDGWEMYEQKINQIFWDKIYDNCSVVIFGACPAGENILKEVAANKKNINVICFIDNFKKGEFCNIPVYTLKEFIDKNLKCDLVIMSTLDKVFDSIDILRIYGYNVLKQNRILYNYFRNNKPYFIKKENYQKVINIFHDEEDKRIFDLIFKYRAGIAPKSEIIDYYNKKFSMGDNDSIINHQYLDKINKEAVRTLIDLGFNSGLNAVAYNRFLPNLENIYGFDAIYDKCRSKQIEQFIENEKLHIIQKCVGASKDKTTFVINTDFPAQSRSLDMTTMDVVSFKNQEKVTVDVIKLDDFCEECNIQPDLIKSDIEGAELSALYGAINTIKKCRPQLAISIYHSNKDFIKIPLYLHENLENYKFKLEHYRATDSETILYAIPNELSN